MPQQNTFPRRSTAEIFEQIAAMEHIAPVHPRLRSDSELVEAAFSTNAFLRFFADIGSFFRRLVPGVLAHR